MDVAEIKKLTQNKKVVAVGETGLDYKAEYAPYKDKQKEIQKRAESGKLSLNDVIEQVKSMNQLGGLDKIKSMIPGFANIGNKIPEGMLESQQEKIAKWEHIIKSMTSEEKENPEILEKQTSRIARVASGAGVHTSDVRSLLKQYNMLNDMIKSGSTMNMDLSNGMSQKQMMKFAKKFMKKGKLRLFLNNIISVKRERKSKI